MGVVQLKLKDMTEQATGWQQIISEKTVYVVTVYGEVLMLYVCVCICLFGVCLQYMNVCVCVRTARACEYVCVVCVFQSTEAEELYQRRVLTITGICVALLVVGIVCVVAYCKTKYVSSKKRSNDVPSIEGSNLQVNPL